MQKQLLQKFSENLLAVLARPEVAGKKPLRLVTGEYGNATWAIAGPRCGAIEVNAGLDTGRLKAALSANDCALLRQLIPWEFPKSPIVYSVGRRLRLEAGWPAELQDKDIRLASLALCPHGKDLVVMGRNEEGATVRLKIGDATPHLLMAGTSGSGKSVGMRSVTAQLSQNPTNQFILIDGKGSHGEKGIAPLEGLPGQAGPFCRELEDARNALGWAHTEMKRRYTHGDYAGKLIIVIDEVQEFAEDPLFVDLLKRLTAKGREAGVHLLLGTQYPKAELLGDSSIKQNMGRVALTVKDDVASRLIVGDSEPRADKLLGQGDAYIITDTTSQRVQMAYIPLEELDQWKTNQRGQLLEDWPVFTAEQAGQPLGRPARVPTAEEAGLAVYAAEQSLGRGAFVELFKKHTGEALGSGVARNFLEYGRGVWDKFSALKDG